MVAPHDQTTSEQLMLTLPPSEPDRPRCRMCPRPAFWGPLRRAWSSYCGSTSCTNRERLCQCCGKPFAVGVNGAGSKYCSTECKRLGYHPERADAPSTLCAWCGKRAANVSRNRSTHWPYICEPCVEPIKHVVPRLREHNVPHERARRLVTDPSCEVCGINLLERRRQSNSKVAALLVVDHDHDCCPVESRSCGKCVRGLICRHCNAAAGQLYDSPHTARSLAAYLERWTLGQGTA